MLCAGAVLLGLSLPAAADLTEASRLAEQDPARALAMANAVLVEDPDHIDALLIRARAEAATGRPRAARQSALAAYRAADVQPAHYASAMILADLAGQDGNHTLAQYWLRRAVQHTQTDAEVAQVVRAYQHARRENPWAFQFSIGGAPNSNVNNGSSERIISIQGLPFVLSPTARALSGFSAEATAAVQYRFSRTTNSQSHIGLEVVGRMNWLDAGPRQQPRASPGMTSITTRRPWSGSMCRCCTPEERRSRFRDRPGGTGMAARNYPTRSAQAWRSGWHWQTVETA